MCRPGNICTKSFNLGQDGLGGYGPDEGTSVSIVMFDEVVNLSHQLFDTGQGPATDRLLGDEAEPTLDLF